MLETNIRVVRPGADLHVDIRRAAVRGADLSVDLLQRACNVLRRRHGLAAVLQRGSLPALLVATSKPLPDIRLEQDDWILDISDAAEPTQRLRLTDPDGPSILPQMIERAFLVTLSAHTRMWTLDSPRIWYEPEPFTTQNAIAVHRRFEVATILVDGVGVGIAVDVGTAFFTATTLAHFFDANIPHQERLARRATFAALTGRQQGQKGTLLYDTGRSRTKCYFEDAPDGVTCAGTGTIRVKDKTYDSLHSYYRAVLPELPVRGDALAVRASFPGLERARWVAAERLHVRVMNDDVPDTLSSIDKISPADRRALLLEFWRRLDPRPLGAVAPGFESGLWCPDAARVTRFLPVAVEFGQGHRLAGPTSPTLETYRQYYRRRLECLQSAGCYSIPPTVGRTLYVAHPHNVSEEVTRQLAGDIATNITAWTKRQFSTSLVAYGTIAQAIEQLRRAEEPGTAVFVLDEEPAGYYEAAFHLPGWRIKRITEGELRRHYKFLTNGAWDKKQAAHSRQRGRARWDQFIAMSALDVLQQVDGVPWRVEELGAYEAQLAIDVGHDRRHFALSVLVARSPQAVPSFAIISEVLVKPDPRHEMINPVLLADQIVRLFRRLYRSGFSPIGSLLVLRDGQICGEEPEGMDRAVAMLHEQGILVGDARVDVVDFHKDSLKSIRFWEVAQGNDATNPLEGTAIHLNQQVAVVAATGAATLQQGTAQPFMLAGNGRCPNILDAAGATFAAAQLNWSNPTRAQRFPVVLKRTDDELTARAAQEIRRIR